MTVCQREGCDNPLKTGRKFCSAKCSANRNKPKPKIEVVSQGSIPDDVVSMVESVTGKSPEMLRMMELVAAEQKGDVVKVPSLSTVRTVGEWVLSWDGKKEYRPDDALAYETIDKMAENGVVKFATYVKKAGALAPFRSQRTWRIWSTDDPLQRATTAAMDRIIFRMMSNAIDSMFIYGNSIQETVFANMTSYELGLSKSRSAREIWTMPKLPKQVHPATVSHIRRTAKMKFNGFVQKPNSAGFHNEIQVPVQNSLVLVNEEKFRSIWGTSSYEAVYPLWFWYEVVIRSMVRYMERMGTPVTVVTAPSKKMVRKPGTTDLVDAMVWGLAVAGNAGVSSALALPSDIDPHSGKPLWDIKYLTAQERSQPFIDVLEQLTQMILRSMIIADRAVSKDSGTTGSYGMAEVHARANSIQNQMTVAGIVGSLNDYFFPWIAKWKRGASPPPLRFMTQGQDVQDIDMITKLFGVAGNSPLAQDALGRVDYERMAIDAGIAFLDEGQFDRKKKKLEEESLAKQEAQMKLNKKFAKDESPNQGAKSSTSQIEKGKVDDAKKAEFDYEKLAKHLLDRGALPLILSESDINKLRTSSPIRLVGDDWEEEKVVRDASGRFAKKEGKKEPNPSKNIPEQDTPQGLLEGMGLNKDELAFNLKVIADAKGYESVDAMVSDIEAFVAELGMTGFQDTTGKLSSDMVSSGHYDPDTDTITVNEKLKAAFLQGNPVAVDLALHEFAHSRQEGNGESPVETEARDMDEYTKQFSHYNEGQNELMARILMSKYYDTPITDPSKQYGAAAHAMMGYGENKWDINAYDTYTGMWAGIAQAHEQKTGEAAVDFLYKEHDNGMSSTHAEKTMRDLFGDRMNDYGKQDDGSWTFPDYETTRDWLNKDYGITNLYRSIDDVVKQGYEKTDW